MFGTLLIKKYLFPNVFKEHEMIESCLFLPQKKKLMETKDKEMEDQAYHFQAETVKSKLGSIIRFLKFFEDNHLCRM